MQAQVKDFLPYVGGQIVIHNPLTDQIVRCQIDKIEPLHTTDWYMRLSFAWSAKLDRGLTIPNSRWVHNDTKEFSLNLLCFHSIRLEGMRIVLQPIQWYESTTHYLFVPHGPDLLKREQVVELEAEPILIPEAFLA